LILVYYRVPEVLSGNPVPPYFWEKYGRRPIMTLGDLQMRFVALLRKRIRNGELTERGLARLVGVSQPHVHHVLRGKRSFSIETTDNMMRRLRVDVLDLIEPAEWAEGRKRT
jgi:predicted XRE-type DNA-binding protein